MPGGACTLTVSVPSLNGGRNSPPIQKIDATDDDDQHGHDDQDGVGVPQREAQQLALEPLQPAEQERVALRAPGTRRAAAGSDASTGVTVSDTSSEASSETT